MKVIILAGGLGTRLKGVLGGLPKPMASIGGRPFLEYLVDRFKSLNRHEFIFSVGHEGKKIRDYFASGRKFGVSIQYTNEIRLMGTGGAVKLAEPLIDTDDFFVVNGDTYLEADLQAMLRFHRSSEAIATIALARREDTGRYGGVVRDRSNRIISFEEKARGGKAGDINGGLYIFRSAVFDRIPANAVCSLEREILPALIGKGLFGFPVDGYFIDIGIPEDYEKAKKELPSRRAI